MEQPTHISYDQALEILGPYLDTYLNSGHLSRGGGFYENADGVIVSGDDVISLGKVIEMADYLYSSGHDYKNTPDINPPAWPKETKYWTRPVSDAQAITAPQALLDAVASGISLESLQAQGAPSAGDLQAFIDGTAQASPQHVSRIREAVARINESVGTK